MQLIFRDLLGWDRHSVGTKRGHSSILTVYLHLNRVLTCDFNEPCTIRYQPLTIGNFDHVWYRATLRFSEIWCDWDNIYRQRWIVHKVLNTWQLLVLIWWKYPKITSIYHFQGEIDRRILLWLRVYSCHIEIYGLGNGLK